MQLTLRYKNLDEYQRSIVWSNFITNLEKHQQSSYSYEEQVDKRSRGLLIDIDGIRSNLSKLASTALNGRQIRNAVSTARQLAMFRGEPMGLVHLETAIGELEKFDSYLKDVKGVSEDTIQRDRGAR